MNENWVLDASPIILLGKADLLKTVSPLAKVWIIPEAVIREVEAKRPIEPYLPEISYSAEVVKENVSKIHPSIAVGLHIDSAMLTRILTRIGEGDKAG